MARCLSGRAHLGRSAERPQQLSCGAPGRIDRVLLVTVRVAQVYERTTPNHRLTCLLSCGVLDEPDTATGIRLAHSRHRRWLSRALSRAEVCAARGLKV